MSLDHCDLLFRDVRHSKSLAEICHTLQPIFDRYESERLTLGLERGAFFWRARICKDAEPWRTVDDMGAPPRGIAGAGRFNDPAASLLYAALKEETALAEIDARPGQIVQVIGYRTLLEHHLRLAVVGELMHVHKLGYMRFTGSDPEQSVSHLLNGLGSGRGREVTYIDAFLHSLLADGGAKENDYIFTRAVAAMIFQDPDIDGIVFASTRDSLGFNITLRPEVAAVKLHAMSCFQCRVDAVRDYGFMEFSLLRDAKRLLEGGSFEWAEPLPPPGRRFFNLTKEEYEIFRRFSGDPNAFLEMTRAHRRR